MENYSMKVGGIEVGGEGLGAYDDYATAEEWKNYTAAVKLQRKGVYHEKSGQELQRSREK